MEVEVPALLLDGSDEVTVFEVDLLASETMLDELCTPDEDGGARGTPEDLVELERCTSVVAVKIYVGIDSVEEPTADVRVTQKQVATLIQAKVLSR